MQIPGNPNQSPEGKGSAPNEQPLGEDELKARMADLKTRVVEQLKRPSDEEIQKYVQEHQSEVMEDDRLLPLLQEAEAAIKDFEALLQQRTVADKQHLKEVQELKDLVASLKQQRDAALQENLEMEKQFEAEEKAAAAQHARELREIADRVSRTLGSTVDKFLKEVEELEIKRAYLFEQEKKQEEDLNAVKAKVEATVKEAVDKLADPKLSKTQAVVIDLGASKTYQGYLASLMQYRKTLGIFHLKEKGAIDLVLKRSAQFKEADEKTESYDTLVQEIKALDGEIRKKIDDYKQLILSAEQGTPSK